VAAVPFWWHSIDLGDGVVAPGVKTPDRLAAEWSALDLGDLSGRSVLDIGAWDGFFSFSAERAGPSRVVALDFHAWGATQQAAHVRGYESSVPNQLQLDDLPGRAGFDLAKRLLGSRVEPVVADFTTVDLSTVGSFDVVLFLGVLYHLEDPLGALRRLRTLTDGIALIETAAVSIPDHLEANLWEFYPSDELGGDPTNWWAPSAPALVAACRAAGFADAEVLLGPPLGSPDAILRYRAVVRARVQ
jgi:tRNA (mo5U34)-methyltransferase